jgi:hypothetical protein
VTVSTGPISRNVSDSAQTLSLNEQILVEFKPTISRWRRAEARRERVESVMHDAQRYRVLAAERLLAARECEPQCRALHLSMALSWLSLARQDELTENVLADREPARAA